MAVIKMFVVNGCFLYYALIAFISVVIIWIVILYEYPTRHSPSKYLIWPYTAKTWEYLTDNIIFYLIWTAAIIAFTWASYLADCTRSISDNLRLQYRSVFLFVNLGLVASHLLFYLFQNVTAALITIVLTTILTVQLIVDYTQDATDYGWLLLPLFLWEMYFIAVCYHFTYHNAHAGTVL
jgi:tryptophan-rich sensory protein